MASDQRYVSNDLSHFVGRSLTDDEAQYQLLVRILREGRLLANPPPGDPHASGYGINKVVNFSTGKRYESLTVCFCDIPERDLSIHVAKYSRFGLSFPKPFLIEREANPVFYLVRQAPFLNMGTRAEHFDNYVRHLDCIQQVFRERGTRETSPGSREWCDRTDQLAWDVLGFFEGAMLLFVKWFDADIADDHLENWYMEREWRTLQTVYFSLEDVSRVFIPKEFALRLRSDVLDYCGQLTFLAG